MKRLSEYLIENLKSHNYLDLCELIYNEYKDDITEIIDYINKDTDKKAIAIGLKSDAKTLNYDNLINKNECLKPFFKLIEFYNYGYKVEEKEYNDKNNTPIKLITLVLDPIYPIEVSDLFAKYDRQAYHFTDKDNKESILKYGLQTRKQNTNFENIERRIYLYMSNEPIDLKKIDFETLGLKNSLRKRYIAFKVDMSTLNYNVYQDGRSQSDRAIFIYNDIPPKFLTLVE